MAGTPSHISNRLKQRVSLIIFLLLVLPVIAQARQVRVGVYGNKPLVFKDEQGTYQGLSIDILRSAAKINGWELQFIEGSWQECLQRLKRGDIDLQVAIADSTSRRELFDFTPTSLITNWGRVYSRQGQPYASLLELKEKTVSIVESDIHAKVFSDLMDKFDLHVTLQPVADYDEVLQAVADKTADAGVVNRMYAMQNAQRFAVSQTPMIFNPIRVCYAVPKGKSGHMIAALSNHLQELKNNHRSLYYKSLEQWFGKDTGQKIPRWLLNAIFVLAALLLLFFIILLILKQQVAVRTAELNESRRKYQTLFSRSTDAIFVSNMEGMIIDVNEEACRSLGYTFEELTQLSIPEVDRTAVKNNHMKTTWILLQDGRTVTLESEHTRKDGSTFPVEIHIGKIAIMGRDAILGVARDITERKRMESERDLALHNLSAERERLSVTLRSIGDGVITTDRNGIIVFINRITEQLTGWTEQEAIGQPVEEVFHIINEKTGKACENPAKKVISRGVIVGLANHTALIARDGTQRSIADSGAPIRDHNSNIIGTVLVFRDVTLEKKTEQELLKIKKLESIGVLAGGIAHDFNNILAAILGNINLATQYLDSTSKARPLLLEAEKASTRARQLTQQLLTFSKGGEPVKSTESLPELIRESAEFVLHGSNIACKYQIPEDLWKVEVDRGQMAQVIQNLVINSRHAMPEGGTISISCTNVEENSRAMFQGLQDEKYVRIVFRDTGIGIPEQLLDRIFDPYFSTKQEGSGLGLAITHSIINKHDGYIQVHSLAGHGTTFTLYLPACRETHTEQTESTADLQSGTGTILIMDDDELVLRVAKQMLVHLGFDVVISRNGKEAIAEYQRLLEEEKPVTAIIMDLTIPGGMGGKDAVHEIHRINPSARVIATSGYSTDPIMANFQEYGFNSSVTKPFSLAELSRAINTALS